MNKQQKKQDDIGIWSKSARNTFKLWDIIENCILHNDIMYIYIWYMIQDIVFKVPTWHKTTMKK